MYHQVHLAALQAVLQLLRMVKWHIESEGSKGCVKNAPPQAFDSFDTKKLLINFKSFWLTVQTLVKRLFSPIFERATSRILSPVVTFSTTPKSRSGNRLFSSDTTWFVWILASCGGNLLINKLDSQIVYLEIGKCISSL